MYRIIKFNADVLKYRYDNFKNRFNRDDCLIAFGGGITGDVVGYCASNYKRGIRFINIPTTLLSQVDSSIGGKTGINNSYGKYIMSLLKNNNNFDDFE